MRGSIYIPLWQELLVSILHPILFEFHCSVFWICLDVNLTLKYDPFNMGRWKQHEITWHDLTDATLSKVCKTWYRTPMFLLAPFGISNATSSKKMASRGHAAACQESTNNVKPKKGSGVHQAVGQWQQCKARHQAKLVMWVSWVRWDEAESNLPRVAWHFDHHQSKHRFNAQ